MGPERLNFSPSDSMPSDFSEEATESAGETVFGMGTGDPSRQSHPKTQGSVAWRSPAFAVVAEHPENRTVMIAASKHMGVGTRLSSSPRPISTGPLHGLPRFHFRPIYLVVCQGPY